MGVIGCVDMSIKKNPERKNRKSGAVVRSNERGRPRITHHTYFEECQLTRTSKNIKSRKVMALEINRLIHGAIAQGAVFVDLAWDEKKKWFTLFARRKRQVA